MKVSRSYAFTLVELMAVIAIIASLVAILFPVMSGAIGSAKKVTCASNLYNIGVATGLYLGDNNDVYPETVNYVSRYMPKIQWGLPVGLDPRDYESPVEAMGAYISNPEIWRCPQDNGWSHYRYGVKFYPTLWQWNDGTSYLFSELFEHQTSTSLAGVAYDIWATDAGPAWHGIPQPLSTGYFYCNNLHFDGHVNYGLGCIPYIPFSQVKNR